MSDASNPTTSVYLLIGGLIGVGFLAGAAFSYVMERTRWSLYRKTYVQAAMEAKAHFESLSKPRAPEEPGT